MINRKVLREDLKRQVKAVESDLEKQVRALRDVDDRLKGEHAQAFKLGRTAATWNSWLEERITQVSAAWVLGSVFVRFCEDNLLIPEPYITGPTADRRDLALERYAAYVHEDADPTYRGWLDRAFTEIGTGQAGKLLFNPDHNPLYQIPLSHDGARDLIEFWRNRDESGNLAHDFTDPLSDDGTSGWDTRFLGDLYEDLSEDVRTNYALFQTPEFVEEFILDRTMDPVIRELGAHFGELKMIDPTCGSGHFVLGAFRRMERQWSKNQPHVDVHERVRAALDSIHGVDINPFAVAIARFRLLVAAMATANISTLDEASRYDWPIHLAVGDSLIKSRQLELTLEGEKNDDQLAKFSYATEDVHEYSRILDQGRYHVVVGNPPYITVKDKNLNKLYRDLYPSCTGKYALSVPFAERFFQLAKAGDENGRGFGMVGQITANSFMKRGFGAKLIEEFFAHKVELTEVIDTSGAYIPGHGTPTVILVGRRRGGPGRSGTIRTVRSIQGEPTVPDRGEVGQVWQAILRQIDQPGSVSLWVSVDDLDRKRYFDRQPWILVDGGLEMVEQIETNKVNTLRRVLGRDIGFASFPGQDDAFVSRPEALQRQHIADEIIKPLIIGEVVRDWDTHCVESALAPYSPDLLPLPYDDSEPWARLLWIVRSHLRSTKGFDGKTQHDLGKPWWAWYRWVPERYRIPLSITFAFVSTHNHFVLDRGGKVFKQTAPVIKLPSGASEEEHLNLLGLLNSSTACFWLKMMAHNKGSTVDSRGARQTTIPFEDFYEFASTKVGQFPLRRTYPTALATSLDRLAQELAVTSPTVLTSVDKPVPTAAALRDARANWESTRARMIALQEELDWQVYSIYNLHGEDLRAPEGDVPELVPGERAFEIVLARRARRGNASDEWFKRHDATPITTLPEHWPDAYKAVVQKRIDAIESSRAIDMIERPEYKRRWATEGWDVMQDRALRSTLLDRIENRDIWYQDDHPTLLTRAQLTDALSRDEVFVSVGAIYAPYRDLPAIVTALLADEHVPFLAALRYKPDGLKKRADWEHVWVLQREEDAIRKEDPVEEERAKRKFQKSIPVPKKYTNNDFLKQSYWRARGKLDVPKERFISYSITTVGTPDLYGWAGWDHREQAQALTTYFTNHELAAEELTPFLAGLLELQPWLNQWHGEFDALYGMSPATFFAGYRAQIQGEHGLTDEDLRAWRPATRTRGRRTAKKN
ncbi:BREX-2 system adenine-specific DNA-methyltransferase PglX [Saccharopolyspora pogona]|uniref:BREX-2 system adenine-specific DNA-methyltransferase PglX n=1 Tax=Saccharopolyspora pogona TaxID=333966 RepID=UPI001681FBE1|nr:BREX-2 system adenine-specific DNA-methyltransferase PglX [Saccharopolyspora pogona]